MPTGYKMPEQKVHYIHNNPVRNSMVVNPKDYTCSSARKYAGLNSAVDLITVDIRWKTYK